MRIEEQRNKITLDDGTEVDLYSPEGFRALSKLWLKVEWDQKHLYSFTWLGRPLIQLPDDLMRIQEVIFSLKPDVIIETGIAHGGSLIFYATLLKAMERGKVVGVDVEIRPRNRKAVEAHILAPYITMIEGSSIDPKICAEVKGHIPGGAKTLVILDSDHTYDHVLAELHAYAPFVSPGSYIVATDGSMEFLYDTPRARREYKDAASWPGNNPKKAAEDFVAVNSAFRIVEPSFPFNESAIDFRLTHWPSCFVERIR